MPNTLSGHFDYVIVGGGIVGLSTSWQLTQHYPTSRIAILEKESGLCQHQSGRNSGVVHAGVYYPPGSLKARFCREGLADTKKFCEENGLPFEQCGKLLVATTPDEIVRMEALYQRCLRNGVDMEKLDAKALSVREPNASGLAALFVRDTAIVDYKAIGQALGKMCQDKGCVLMMDTAVTHMREQPDYIEIQTESRGKASRIRASFVVCCVGLMADRLARMLDIRLNFRIIPYRGEYYGLAPESGLSLNHLIYPIPDPRLPFLGIHLTKTYDNRITIGPNAVQALKREGYNKLDFNLQDTIELLGFGGFWRVTAKHFRSGTRELLNSFSKRAFLQQARKYCPVLRPEWLSAYPAGVRAQAVLEDGTLVHDFLFAESPRSLHVCNAPSPAATSAFPIGKHILYKLITR